ncbi:MAG TPA: hypothetical protein VKD71_14315, partial [Gemmataceae bacterium]|nr:hypothetical protein [Gemmataceae bacterium]
MTAAREPPYPPPPRQVGDKPDELGRRPSAGPVIRAIRLVAHLAAVALYAGAPILALFVAYLCLQATDLFVVFRVLGFIVCLTFAVVYLKSLLPRRLPLGPAVVPVQPDDQPTAHAFLTRVADDVGSRPPRRMLIGSGVELWLGGRRSVLDLMFGATWNIQIGLWLWHGLTLSEFQSLAARTLAPLGRGRFERFRFTTRCLLEALVDGVDRLDELGTASRSAVATIARIAQAAHRIAIAPLRAIGRVLLHAGIDKEDALLDDLAAVRVAGSDALVHAVLRADFAGATLREIDESLMLAARQGVFTQDLYALVADAAVILREAHNDFTLGEPPFLRGPHAGKHADVFEPGQRYLSAMWRGLPGPSEREHNAKRNFVPAERDDRPAAELLDEPTRLRETLATQRYIEHHGVTEDFLPFRADTIRLWLGAKADEPFPAKYAGCYDGGRRLQPGTRAELDSALAADNWDDVRLLSTANGLYAHAGERASRWRGARQALERLLRRTLYRP